MKFLEQRGVKREGNDENAEKKVLYHDFVEVQNDFVVFDFHFYRMQYDFSRVGKNLEREVFSS